ncbi:MAG: hypothetical protein U0L49_06590 [Eubacterium sp.]|nr:hypothetical protein [Eubacterium sp.]
MILLHCSVENFGLLHEYELDLDRGFNSFLMDNGQGKSTIVSFIRAMFYGLEGDRRKSIIDSDRKRYSPWQGGRFGGSLTFSYRGTAYRIERFFGLRKAEDTFSLTNAATGRSDSSFSEEIGQELFGMDAESFTNTILIGRQSLAIHITSDMHALLGPLGGSPSEPADLRNYRQADRSLHEALNRLSPDRKTGLLYKKKEELSKLDAEERLHIQEHSERRILLEERIFGHQREDMAPEEMEEEAAALFSRFDRKFQNGLPDENEIRSRMEELQNIDPEDYIDPEGNVDPEGYIDPEDGTYSDGNGRDLAYRKYSQKRTVLLFLLLTAGTAAALFGHFLDKQLLTAGGVLLILASLFAFFLTGRSFHRQADDEEYDRDRLRTIKEREKQRKKELTELLRKEKDVVLYQRLFDYLNLLEEEAKDAEKRSHQKKVLQQELKESEHRYQVLSLTRCYLQQARDLFCTELTGPLLASFKDYFSRASGLKEIPFQLDADLKLTLIDRGSTRDTESLSQGWQDMAGLCMRLALIDAMYPDDPPCLILDDPFVNMDQDHIQSCLDLLTDLASRYQILYFTCHESRC